MYDKAIHHYELALKITLENNSNNHENISELYRNLGECFHILDKPDETIEMILKEID